MFRLALLSAILALALGQKKYCCTPDQWEGHLAEVSGSVVAGATHLLTASVNISYDYTNTKLATSSYLIVDDKPQYIKVIEDFKAKMMYTITVGKCTPTQLTGDMVKYCVPDNATAAGKVTYGLGKQSLDVQAYSLPMGKDMSLYMTTTTANPCVPVGEVLYGSLNKVSSIQSMGYYNISPGIKDPRVFDPPASCKGQKHMKPAPALSDMMNFFHAKVTKN